MTSVHKLTYRSYVVSNCLFFFNDTATTEIYTLSLHDALPIFGGRQGGLIGLSRSHKPDPDMRAFILGCFASAGRSEEHTSELQSRQYLVCRLLLEKKKITQLAQHIQLQLEPTSTPSSSDIPTC